MPAAHPAHGPDTDTAGCGCAQARGGQGAVQAVAAAVRGLGSRNAKRVVAVGGCTAAARCCVSVTIAAGAEREAAAAPDPQQQRALLLRPEPHRPHAELHVRPAACRPAVWPPQGRAGVLHRARPLATHPLAHSRRGSVAAAGDGALPQSLRAVRRAGAGLRGAVGRPQHTDNAGSERGDCVDGTAVHHHQLSGHAAGGREHSDAGVVV